MSKWHLRWSAALAFVIGGCLLDDDRCGAHQQSLNTVNEGCVCESGAVPNPDGIGCRVCGAHEAEKGGACACVAGYARPSPSAACEPEQDSGAEADAGASPGPRGQDTPCDSSDDCMGFDATFCLTLVTPNVCRVQGCARGETRCAADRVCCEVTVLPELAAAGGLCVAPTDCQAPGMVVTP